MKKIFLFAAAAMVSLSSCVQTNEVYTGELNEIGFKSAAVRDVIDGVELPDDASINVTAVWDKEGDGTYAERFITKFVKKNDVFGGETPQYWPNGGKMQFIGYYPYGVGGFTANYGTKGEIAGYKVTGIDGDDQHDILYSDLVGPVESPQAGAQAMIFRHALAQLTCTFATNAKGDNKVVVKSATINNVVLSGDLTVTAGNPSTFAWDNTSSVTTHNFLTAATGELTDSSALVETDPLLVVPGATTTLVVVYTINGGADQTATLTLADYSNAKWDAGNKYVYQFMINANEILFDCTLEPWNEVIVGTTTGITI